MLTRFRDIAFCVGIYFLNHPVDISVVVGRLILVLVFVIVKEKPCEICYSYAAT